MKVLSVFTSNEQSSAKFKNLFTDSSGHSVVLLTLKRTDKLEDLAPALKQMKFREGRQAVVLVEGFNEAPHDLLDAVRTLDKVELGYLLPTSTVVCVMRSRSSSFFGAYMSLALDTLLSMQTSDFCGCHEGDMGNNYPDGVLTFLEKFYGGCQNGGKVV